MWAGRAYLLEEWEDVVPVPALGGIVKLGAANLGPVIVVKLVSAVEELAVDGGAASDSHSDGERGSAVVQRRDGQRLDIEARVAWSATRRFEDGLGVLDHSIFDNEGVS